MSIVSWNGPENPATSEGSEGQPLEILRDIPMFDPKTVRTVVIIVAGGEGA